MARITLICLTFLTFEYVGLCQTPPPPEVAFRFNVATNNYEVEYSPVLPSIIVMGKHPMYEDQPSPLVNEYCDKPGNYEVAGSLSELKLYPNKRTTVEVYFTGYGIIEYPKLLFRCSSPIFDVSSKVYFSIGVDSSTAPYLNGQEDSLMFTSFSKNLKSWYFGRDSSTFSGPGHFVLNLKGKKANTNWKNPTYFVDAKPGTQSHEIITEDKIVKAPLSFDLLVNDKAESGDYVMYLYFTYYNGQEWKTSKQDIQVHINNPFEEHYYITNGIAIFAVVISLFAFLIQIYQFFREKHDTYYTRGFYINRFLIKIWKFLVSILIFWR